MGAGTASMNEPQVKMTKPPSGGIVIYESLLKAEFRAEGLGKHKNPAPLGKPGEPDHYAVNL